jgi:enoyl-CoA hydratase
MNQVIYKTLLYEKDKEEPHIVYITLNRPEKNNAISIGDEKMTGEIQDAIKRVNEDEDVKVAIFRGSGENFSGGFDLTEVYRVYGGAPGVRPLQSVRLKIDEDQLMGMPRAILNCKKVTIAQIHGWCIEAGLWIPESCDIAIATKNAKFAHRGQRLAFGGMPFIPLEVLQGHTKKLTELLITGRTISGEEAEEIGIITKAVEPEILEEEVYNLATAICFLPADAIAMGKLHRRQIYDAIGLNTVIPMISWHTLGTSLRYRDEEKEIIFIRDRERTGARESFHKLHNAFEESLNKTKNFKSYNGE